MFLLASSRTSVRATKEKPFSVPHTDARVLCVSGGGNLFKERKGQDEQRLTCLHLIFSCPKTVDRSLSFSNNFSFILSKSQYVAARKTSLAAMLIFSNPFIPSSHTKTETDKFMILSAAVRQYDSEPSFSILGVKYMWKLNSVQEGGRNLLLKRLGK